MNKLKKFFSKTIVGISLILGIFVGFVAFGSSDVKADTRSISFVLGDSLSEGNPVEASRIVVAGGTDSVNGRNQSVPYQKQGLLSSNRQKISGYCYCFLETMGLASEKDGE